MQSREHYLGRDAKRSRLRGMPEKEAIIDDHRGAAPERAVTRHVLLGDAIGVRPAFRLLGESL